jgi:hypothetical protein
MDLSQLVVYCQVLSCAILAASAIGLTFGLAVRWYLVKVIAARAGVASERIHPLVFSLYGFSPLTLYLRCNSEIDVRRYEKHFNEGKTLFLFGLGC